MTAYIIRRIITAIFVILVVSFITFVIFFGVPRLGGQTTNQLAQQYVGRNPSPDAIQAVIKNLGFDKSIFVQYWDYTKGIFVGRTFKYGPDATTCNVPCLGYSFKNHQPVWPDITSRLTVTFSLALGAAVIWLISGVTIGVISALRRGKPVDRISMLIALAGVSLPIFFTGLLAKAIFAYGPNWLHLYDEIAYVPFTQNPADWAFNLLLPWITLAFLYAALYARLTRAGMLETMSEDYIRTARAKGLVERKVVTKHGLRAALTPIITIFGLDFGLLLGGAVLTERVFNLPGIGQYAFIAITNNDLPQILGVTLVAAFFVVLFNLIVDVVYAGVDPRVRF